jgi:hypothetical protein
MERFNFDLPENTIDHLSEESQEDLNLVLDEVVSNSRHELEEFVESFSNHYDAELLLQEFDNDVSMILTSLAADVVHNEDVILDEIYSIYDLLHIDIAGYNLLDINNSCTNFSILTPAGKRELFQSLIGLEKVNSAVALDLLRRNVNYLKILTEFDEDLKTDSSYKVFAYNYFVFRTTYLTQEAILFVLRKTNSIPSSYTEEDVLAFNLMRQLYRDGLFPIYKYSEFFYPFLSCEESRNVMSFGLRDSGVLSLTASEFEDDSAFNEALSRNLVSLQYEIINRLNKGENLDPVFECLNRLRDTMPSKIKQMLIDIMLNFEASSLWSGLGLEYQNSLMQKVTSGEGLIFDYFKSRKGGTAAIRPVEIASGLCSFLRLSKVSNKNDLIERMFENYEFLIVGAQNQDVVQELLEYGNSINALTNSELYLLKTLQGENVEDHYNVDEFKNLQSFEDFEVFMVQHNFYDLMRISNLVLSTLDSDVERLRIANFIISYINEDVDAMMSFYSMINGVTRYNHNVIELFNIDSEGNLNFYSTENQSGNFYFDEILKVLKLVDSNQLPIKIRSIFLTIYNREHVFLDERRRDRLVQDQFDFEKRSNGRRSGLDHVRAFNRIGHVLSEQSHENGSLRMLYPGGGYHVSFLETLNVAFDNESINNAVITITEIGDHADKIHRIFSDFESQGKIRNLSSVQLIESQEKGTLQVIRFVLKGKPVELRFSRNQTPDGRKGWYGLNQIEDSGVLLLHDQNGNERHHISQIIDDVVSLGRSKTLIVSYKHYQNYIANAEYEGVDIQILDVDPGVAFGCDCNPPHHGVEGMIVLNISPSK